MTKLPNWPESPLGGGLVASSGLEDASTAPERSSCSAEVQHVAEVKWHGRRATWVKVTFAADGTHLAYRSDESPDQTRTSADRSGTLLPPKNKGWRLRPTIDSDRLSATLVCLTDAWQETKVESTFFTKDVKRPVEWLLRGGQPLVVARKDAWGGDV